MNPKDVLDILSRLRALPMFPNDEGVLESLLILCGAMCKDESQVDWLVRRMTSGLYEQWPGPREMRACFCSRFRPKDGLSISSMVYLDGIPSEKPQVYRGIEGQPALMIGEPEQPLRPEPQKAVDDLKQAMPKAPRPARSINAFGKHLKEILTAPCDRPPLPPPTPQIITQADIDEAVAEHRAKKAAGSPGKSAGLEKVLEMKS